MTQQEYLGTGTIQQLKNILYPLKGDRIFLVRGKQSYSSCGAKEKIKKILKGYKIREFFDFALNPKLEDVIKGIKEYKEFSPDVVLAIGGGSVIDIAKTINILAQQDKSPEKYIKAKEEITKPGVFFVAIPTTAGTGSEATHFAVVYIGKTKYSLEHKEFLLPNAVIIDSNLMLKLPPRITACTGMDAFCQAVEAYWSVNSTDQAKEYAKEAIKLSFNNLCKAVNNPDEESRFAMAMASNLAGKAINIAKTTACHAISYPITSYFNVPHGHAVALTIRSMLVYNSKVSEYDVLDKRGVGYVKKVMEDIVCMLNASNFDQANNSIEELMKKIGLETNLSELNITKTDLEIIIKNGFNPSRIKNNPRLLTENNLRLILSNIL